MLSTADGDTIGQRLFHYDKVEPTNWEKHTNWNRMTTVYSSTLAASLATGRARLLALLLALGTKSQFLITVPIESMTRPESPGYGGSCS